MNLSLQLILIGAAESIYHHPLWLAASTKPSSKCKTGSMPTELAGSETLNEWMNENMKQARQLWFYMQQPTGAPTKLCSVQMSLLTQHNKLTRDSKSTWLKIKLKSNTILLQQQDEHFSSLSKTLKLSQWLDGCRGQETWDDWIIHCSLFSCLHCIWFILASLSLLATGGLHGKISKGCALFRFAGNTLREGQRILFFFSIYKKEVSFFCNCSGESRKGKKNL